MLFCLHCSSPAMSTATRLLDDSPKQSDVEFEVGSPLEEFVIEDSVPATDMPTTKMYEGHKVILQTDNILLSWKLKFQFLAVCIDLAIMGLIDQTLGSVMEHLLEDYRVDRTKVSYLFLMTSGGYLPAGFVYHFLMYNFGLYKVHMLGLVFFVVGCSCYGFHLPYFCLLFGSLCNGFAAGFTDCTTNVFVGGLKYANQLMGIMHASYGLGCLLSPVIVVHLISKGMKWYHFYFLIGSLAIFNFFLVFISFRDETKWKFRYTSETLRKENGDTGEEAGIWETARNGYVMFYAFACFVYIASEVEVGVWLFNYIINIKQLSERHASFIASGFWVSLTLGRLSLGFVTDRLFGKHEAKAITIYWGLVTFFGLGFYFFQSYLPLQTFCIILVGFFLAPIFATAMVTAINNLPARFSTSGVPLIAGVGSGGGAVGPSVMGFVAEHTAGGDGKGLVYFPLVNTATFAAATLMWVVFYFYNRRDLVAAKRFT